MRAARLPLACSLRTARARDPEPDAFAWLTARGKTMVVYGVRPRLKGKAAAMSAAAAGVPSGLALASRSKAAAVVDDEEDDEEEDEE